MILSLSSGSKQGFSRIFFFHAHCTFNHLTCSWIKAGRWRREKRKPWKYPCNGKLFMFLLQLTTHLLLFSFQNSQVVLFCIMFKDFSCYQIIVDVLHLGKHWSFFCLFVFNLYIMFRYCFGQFWLNFALKYIIYLYGSKVKTIRHVCCGLNCILSKITCWSSDPRTSEYDRFWR